MKLWVGTSGFSYKKWKGHFYPEDLPDKDMLKYYGKQLPAVEINNTFYRLPNVGVLENWAEQVPENFRFVLKASRKITHFKKLKDAGDETHYLYNTAQTLDDRLGVILFQLPPYLRQDNDLLKAFLSDLPDPTKAAFEFRHHSWFDDETYKTLQADGAALCIAETDDNVEPDLVSTANWGYFRMRRDEYKETDLKKWAKKVQAQKWENAFVFFKHEDAGAGPKLARKFLELAHG
ncbi:DUF72 domain-containing protein [bacterium]|nr:DUF72 domain-containing protein [bacterium]